MSHSFIPPVSGERSLLLQPLMFDSADDIAAAQADLARQLPVSTFSSLKT
ncbi:hypothetical protein P0D88_46560 [Paraburkholderia sp. RL18-103-BIB-C]